MSSGSGVTEVSVAYLRGLSASLGDILKEVNHQLNGQGSATSTTSLTDLVDSDLQVLAGSPCGGSGLNFDAAASLNTALSTMGGSVHDQLQWLSTVLSAMIAEVNTAIKAVGKAETLNNEEVDALIAEFEQTIGVHYPIGSTK